MACSCRKAIAKPVKVGTPLMKFEQSPQSKSDRVPVPSRKSPGAKAPK